MLSRTIRVATRTRTTTPFLTSTSIRHYTTPNNPTPKSPHTPTHTTDTYSKEIDSTPAPDPQIHRIDPGSDKVQKPYEPPSGEFSQAGVETGEYQSVYKIGDAPYEVDGGGEGKEGKGEGKGKEGGEERLRYGGKKRLGKEQRQSSSHAGEGPEGEDAGGRGA